MRIGKKAKQLNVIGNYGVWVWYKLMVYWNEHKHCTHSVAGYQFRMPLPPQRHPDSKTCTTWVWTYDDAYFHDLAVSIDFVPAIKSSISMSRARSTWLMSEVDISKRESYIVPKVPHENSKISERFAHGHLAQLGRISYPTLEVEHLLSLDERVKSVYLAAKCVRKPEVCQFKVMNSQGQVYSVGHYVTSYRLKTSFLHLVVTFKDSDLSLERMVLMVYEYLEECLERGTLPMFFNPSVNVIVGSKLDIRDSLKVARAMTEFVRQLYKKF